ncbi:MAG: cation:proton antiporter [Gammaproteobacteria bacterium]
MNPIATTLLTLGGLFTLGLAGDLLARRTAIPRVSLFLILGLGVGPAGLDLLPDVRESWFGIVTSVALAMVGFVLGQRMTPDNFRRHGHEVVLISLSVILATALIVFGGVLALSADVALALLLAGIALSTDPAATIDVIHEQRAAGPFSEMLQGIVAVDDAWGLIAFSILLAAATSVSGGDGSLAILAGGLWEVFGAMLVGVGVGIPMAYLTGRIASGEPTQAEALGGVLLCAGLAVWLDVSYILASMVLGTVVVNLASHHNRPFAAIEGIEWPFMILFFLLTGASLHLPSVVQAGALGVAYMVLRTLGRVIGGWAGARSAGCDRQTALWMGPSLLPQAGVAIGLGLYASQRFPQYAESIIALVVGSTVVFELVGPLIERCALRATGEAGRTRERGEEPPA